MTSTIQSSTAQIAKLTVSSGGQRVAAHALCDGATVMVGSGANCGIRLEESSISSIHCIIRFTDGELLVQDWCSNLGTYVDDIRIEDETSVSDSKCIRIGKFEILVEMDASKINARKNADSGSSLTNATHQAADYGKDEVPFEYAVFKPQSGDRKEACSSSSDARLEPAVEPAGASEAELTAESADETESKSELESATLDELQDEFPINETILQADAEATVESSEAPSETSDDEFIRHVAPITSGDVESARQSKSRRPLVETIDAESISLLQAEIECLQSELVERDLQLAELQQLAEGVELAPAVDVSETEELVVRLEQLLEELETSDHRMRVLEELLRNEQDLTRAQEEEKAQIESWLGDIEKRMSSREKEWLAEKEALLARVEHIREERDELDQRLEDSEQDPNGSVIQGQVVKELRNKVDTLQEELELSNRRRQSAEEDLAAARSKDPEVAQKELIEQALREERLKLSQEQAALSRERSQLARQLAESEAAVQKDRVNEADQRFRAFRETLKELHSEDKVTSPGVRKASLGTRIADLWRKLDGPTDTD